MGDAGCARCGGALFIGLNRTHLDWLEREELGSVARLGQPPRLAPYTLKGAHEMELDDQLNALRFSLRLGSQTIRTHTSLRGQGLGQRPHRWLRSSHVAPLRVSGGAN